MHKRRRELRVSPDIDLRVIYSSNITINDRGRDLATTVSAVEEVQIGMTVR